MVTLLSENTGYLRTLQRKSGVFLLGVCPDACLYFYTLRNIELEADV